MHSARCSLCLQRRLPISIDVPDRLAVPTPTKTRLSPRSRSDDNRHEKRSAHSQISTPTPSGPTLVAKEEDVVSYDEVDEADGAKIKDVPSFLRGALPDETVRARKHLRRDIESKLEEGRFLTAFSAVDRVSLAAFKLIYHSPSKLETRCTTSTHNSDARRCRHSYSPQTRPASPYSTVLGVCVTTSIMYFRSDPLFSLNKYLNRREVKARQTIVDLFLARFTLSDKETNALSSSNVPVGSTFFATMDRAQAIRDDCRVLMVGEDSPSKAGYE